MRNFLGHGQSQTQGQRNIPLLATRAELFEANTQEYEAKLRALIGNNIFVKELKMDVNDDVLVLMEGDLSLHGELIEKDEIDNLTNSDLGSDPNDLDPEELANLYSKASDSEGYQMAGDGKVNDIPEDRKSYLAIKQTDADLLKEQLVNFSFNDNQRDIAEILIHSLNEKGFLEDKEATIDFIVSRTNISESDARFVLSALKTGISPPGAFAENGREAILLQAQRLEESTTKAAMIALINHRFEELARRDLRSLQSFLHIEGTDLISQVYERMSKFNPVPFSGSGFVQTERKRTEADFFVTIKDGELIVQPNERIRPRITLNREYENLLDSLEKSGKDSHDYKVLVGERETLNGAIELMDHLEKTMTAVVKAILTHQMDFVQSRDQEVKQVLLQKEIAEASGFDASTISRIARSKTVQMDDGKVIELGDMFSLGIRTESGMRESIAPVKQAIRDYIATEDPLRPRKDSEIAAHLKEKQYVIGADNVKNIRLEMEIPDHRTRKEDHIKEVLSKGAVGEIMKKLDITPTDLRTGTENNNGQNQGMKR